MLKYLCLAVVVAALATGPVTGAAAEQDARFRDWRAICPHKYTCRAETEISSSDTYQLRPDFVLRLSRDSYATFWEISLQLYESGYSADAGMIAEVSGRQIAFTGPAEIDAFGLVSDFYLLGEQGQALIDAVMPAHSVRFLFEGADGARRTVEFSLDGLVAALLWIDERQSRVGSERVIAGVPENLQRVPDIPVAAMPKEVSQFHAGNDACDAPEDLVHRDDGIAARLDAANVLYLVPCWAGAYNFGYVAYAFNSGVVRQELFASYSERLGWTGTPFLVTPYFDPLSLILSDFYKGRGIADCGTSGLWQWQGGFRLLEYRAKDDCDGLGEPGRFPVVYRAPEFEDAGRAN